MEKISRVGKVNVNRIEPLGKIPRVAQPLPQPQPHQQMRAVALPRKIASASLVREVKQPISALNKQKLSKDDDDDDDVDVVGPYKYNIISPRGLAGARLPPPK